MKCRALTGTQVLARMAAGDTLTLKGGYTNKAVFVSDGAVVLHRVVTKLLRDGKILPPASASIHSSFRLGNVRAAMPRG